MESQGCDAGGGVSAPSLYNVEAHSLSPFRRACIVRVVRVEGCGRGPWGVAARAAREEGKGRPRWSGRSGVERGERSPLFSSKVVECISNKEVVTVCRHIVEVSQYRTFSIFFTCPRIPKTQLLD